MESTRLSTRGQIVIPKAIREAQGLKPGHEFSVESEGESILLRPVKPYPPRTIEEVLGCAGYHGPRLSLKDMEEAIRKGALESK
jgi:AbrB family looped-hinge helix DNA binding protein